MAYKFQIGRARLSGSIIAEEGVKSDDLSNISSSLDLLADQNVEAGGYVEAGTNVFAGTNVQAAANVVAGGQFEGNLEFELDAGTGLTISSAFNNSGDETIAVDTTWLDARAKGLISADGDLVSYNSSTGLISTVASNFTSSWDVKMAAADTDDLSEGSSNLYYTDARARAAVSAVDAGGDGSFSYNSSTGVFTYTGPSASEVRTHLSADGDLVDYNSSTGVISTVPSNFTASWDVKMAAADTDDLSEGSSNLYYTDARARAAVSAVDAGGDGSFTYNSSTGVFTYTGPSSAEVRAHLSVANTDSIDMSLASGQFSADLNLSGNLSNDALEIVAGEGLDLKSTIAGNRTFSDDITINGDLVVLGNTFSASVQQLLVEDALITIADGAPSLSNGQGFEIGAGLASFKVRTGVTFDAAAEEAFNSSLPIQAPHMKADTFHGELVGTMKLDVVTKVDADTDLDAGKVNRYEDLLSGDADSIALPSGASQGQVVYLKMGDVPDGAYLEVTATDIDGVSSIYLESPNAAVKFICNGSDSWMVF